VDVLHQAKGVSPFVSISGVLISDDLESNILLDFQLLVGVDVTSQGNDLCFALLRIKFAI
jgi:hypothetical protein